MSTSTMSTELAQEVVLSTLRKHRVSRVSDKLFKYQRVIPKKETNNTNGVANRDVFIISFVVDIVFTVCRQFVWAASHIVTKEKFKIPMDNLREQLQVLGTYEHKIRIAINDRRAKVPTDFLEGVRQLRQDAEIFLEQLEQKWYINLWIHEREILEEFQSIQVAMEEVKSSIIDALLSCVEMESLMIRGSRMSGELREHKAADFDYRIDDALDEVLVSWDQM